MEKTFENRTLEQCQESNGEIHQWQNLQNHDPEKMIDKIRRTTRLMEQDGPVTFWIYPNGFDGVNYSPAKVTWKQAMAYIRRSK